MKPAFHEIRMPQEIMVTTVSFPRTASTLPPTIMALLTFATASAAMFAAPAPIVSQETDATPEPSRWESSHSIMVGGETVEYDATVASATLTNDDGDACGRALLHGLLPHQRRPVPPAAARLLLQRRAGIGILLVAHGDHGSAAGRHARHRSAGRASVPARGQRLHPPRHRGHRHGRPDRDGVQPHPGRHARLRLLGHRRGRALRWRSSCGVF